MSISNLIALLGGVALFLFGMSLMGDGLKQAAGNKMELVLYKLSSTTLKSVLLGTAVTMVIQSSAATSAMVVGFVNSSMMTLKQAIGVILGAMFGTSVTGWVVALSEIGEDSSGLLSLLSTSTLTGIVAIIGIIMRMTAKTQAKKHVSSILLGFSILMYGMSTMSSAVAPLKESEKFISLMMSFSNPILGIVIGIIVTAILQSASSAVGLLQALSVTGVIDFEIAFPIILGINIGASAPVLLSSIGARTDARRAAVSYLFMSLAGSGIIGAAFYISNLFVHYQFMANFVDIVDIAIINSVFRLIMVIILFPFIGAIEKLLIKIIPAGENEVDDVIPPLEERFLVNPSVALKQSKDAVHSMVNVVGKNINSAVSLLFAFDNTAYQGVVEREDVVDRYEDKLGAYLIKIAQNELDYRQSKECAEYLHVISDLERISDHALNFADTALEIHDKEIVFSEDGNAELQLLVSAVEEVVGLSFEAFLNDDIDIAYRVEPLEEVIDEMCDEMKDHHVSRLSKGMCTIEHGYAYNDILTNAERVSDHCSNIALAVIEATSEKFDAHDYINNLEKNRTDVFNEYFDIFSKKYALPESIK